MREFHAKSLDPPPAVSLDGVTNVHDRGSFIKWVQSRLQRSRTAVLINIDVNEFSSFNVGFGYAMGDILLEKIALRLSRFSTCAYAVGRLGSDEFGVLIEGEGIHEQASVLVSSLRTELARAYTIEDQKFYVSFSMGTALYPVQASDASQLVLLAEIDRRAATRGALSKKRTSCFIDQQQQVEANRICLVNRLHQALRNDAFRLYLQPQVSFGERSIVSMEALLRWQVSANEIMPPSRFIPVLESSGLIIEVGQWVIAEACGLLMRWERSGLPRVRVAINVSVMQLDSGDLVSMVSEHLQRTGVDPSLLEIEITETALLDFKGRTKAALQELRNLGVRISIDDFGTGNSCLRYLADYELDALKIPRAFVESIGSHKAREDVIMLILGLAGRLNLDTVAEGVETLHQENFLMVNGCTLGQGYLYSRAVTEPTARALVSLTRS